MLEDIVKDNLKYYSGNCMEQQLNVIQDHSFLGQIEMQNLLHTKHEPIRPVPKIDLTYITVQICVLTYFKH
jgi:hypothetical protein